MGVIFWRNKMSKSIDEMQQPLMEEIERLKHEYYTRVQPLHDEWIELEALRPPKPITFNLANYSMEQIDQFAANMAKLGEK